MWSLDSVTDRPPVTGTANCNSSDGEERSVGDNFDGTDPLLGLVALQLTVLVIISALGTFANALVFAVFYRRPSLRTISNRFVLSLIMANLMSAVVSIPGHVYQLLIKPQQQQQQEQEVEVNQDSVGGVTWLEHLSSADEQPNSSDSWFNSWYWHKQGLDGLTVLVSLASVLSILLISLDRYYAVNSPLHYSIIVTRQKSIAMIALVWLVAAILSAPVWAGSVLLQHYGPTPLQPRDNNELELLTDGMMSNGTAAAAAAASEALSGDEFGDQQQQQQYLMNLCYSVSLILFGFVWPLAALCWLYLRMYEAALKNSARTRRQSLCSNTNANATEGVVGAAVAAAAATAAATASSNPPEPSSCPSSHQPSLADAVSSATTAAVLAAASENQTSVRLMAAAAAASSSQRRRSNRYWLRLSGMQQQLLSLFWREEGRALRTTAMVISSFTCCWLPFFVWLLPFQIHPSLTAASSDRQEVRPPAASAGVFLARLAAFSNVLISPAIYVYRNQVAQREAGRVMLLLFCPLRHHHHHRSQSARYSHDIATPLVMGGLGVSGMTPQLHHTSGESRLRANSAAIVSSRRSSSLVTNNSLTESPTRKGSDDPVTVIPHAQATVVNWRGRSGSVDCRVLARNNVEVDTCLSVVPSPILAGGKRRPSRARASISGACGTYSLDRRPSSTFSYEANQIEMRQRSQTFCETRLSSSGGGGGRHPAPNTAVSLRTEVNVSNVSGTTSNDRSGRTKKRPSSNTATAAAAAAAAAAVAAAELKALNHPLAYPSLDFFDIGLEDYGRRSTSSFSRFIQQQPPPLPPPLPPQPAPLLPHISQSSSASDRTTTNGRRRRTCSFSKVLSRGSKQQAGSRWPAVFGSGKQQEIGKSNASSMPSVQQIPSLVTAV